MWSARFAPILIIFGGFLQIYLQILSIQGHRKSVQCEKHSYTWRDGHNYKRMDAYDGTNRRFSRLCKRT